ncbi:MAG TPA: hypothetical protein VLB82_13470, partial [Thermodesulfobacteriota bacterium]|nr:hypothetical protein [Thermodesulfobacteriota bacterium]
MTRKNKKRIKKFGINLKIKPEAFNDVSQLNFLLEDTRNVLLAEIRSKGYKPVNKQKMIPYSHINNI